MIEIENLSKHYTVHDKEPGFWGSVRSFVHRQSRTITAVDNISFQIARGEMIGFLGPNGAGKTTTLKVLAGLLHPSAGRVSVLGYTPKERRRAFLQRITLVMGQKQQLVWDLPALDSFRVNQAIYDIPTAEYEETLREFDELLDLGGIVKQQVRKLSLGERMKCELAAALLHRPEVLFLDEPTIGLDVNMQGRIRSFIAEYNRRFSATVILTSHYMADVTALCKRIVVIDHGKVIFDGNLDDLIARASPGKLIRLELARPVLADQLTIYGQLQRHEGLEADIVVPRADVSAIAAQLLTCLPVADVTIEDPPIETIIGQLFGGKALAPQVGAQTEITA
ncbi:MAG: ATP-binding cassette domain-containing protein [Herpetosiphon sp.]